MKKFPSCPKCGKKGLHYPMHPHAFGWKDYTRAECRFCKSTFKIKHYSNEDEAINKS